MSRGLTSSPYYRFCDGTNARGNPCGNKVPKGIRLCHAHRNKALTRGTKHFPRQQPNDERLGRVER